MSQLFCRLTFFLGVMALAATGSTCGNEFVPVPTPFEIIYVTPYEVLSTPYGSYYRNPSGEYEKVRSISRDGNGTYVIKVTMQCPICGKCYAGTTPDEGYCCPLNEIEVYPHIWLPSDVCNSQGVME